jgi:hypothetical protein
MISTAHIAFDHQRSRALAALAIPAGLLLLLARL